MFTTFSRSLIASLALASLTSIAQAATVTYRVGEGSAGLALQPGFGSFVFSQGEGFDGTYESTGGAIGTMMVLNVVPTPLDGAVITTQTAPGPDGALFPIPVGHQAGLKLASVSYDDQNGSLQAIGLSGGYSLSGSRIPGILAGGNLRITDLRIDLGLGVVTADVAGARTPTGGTNPGEVFSLDDVALWSFAQIAGPANFDPSALELGETYSASYRIGALQLTADGKEVFRRSLGLLVTGQAAVNAINGSDPTGFGTLSVGVVMAPVPEADAYALIVGGLSVVGALGGARRSRRG